MSLHKPPPLLLLTSLLLLCITTTVRANDLQVIMKATEAYKHLNANQQQCVAGNILSVSRTTNCDDKNCLCANPQEISDLTDRCMVYFGDWTNQFKGIYSIDTYNGVMTFFANECGGTFEPQFKVSLRNRPFVVGVCVLLTWCMMYQCWYRRS